MDDEGRPAGRVGTASPASPEAETVRVPLAGAAQEALERKENREKWEFPRLEVRRLVEGSEELGTPAAMCALARLCAEMAARCSVVIDGAGALESRRLRGPGLRGWDRHLFGGIAGTASRLSKAATRYMFHTYGYVRRRASFQSSCSNGSRRSWSTLATDEAAFKKPYSRRPAIVYAFSWSGSSFRVTK